ncbi:hypothetical protein B0T26DRAFT_740669 [Lasiosphaeria miniovina]|uniref:Regulator of G protein signaling superfamily n=1 Tax=Lasiosphaeria miniovina TaxID=1954250 RepID=A0AA40DZD4_9PEZI|nr:uncharacterized protein B0T26DRAFT_740669 [Lasiosphaeria miniovina]KAK0717138.1 hypothetical protein B0T26DRAFT_740669 [Lasiosphaeria miniovina]
MGMIPLHYRRPSFVEKTMMGDSQSSLEDGDGERSLRSAKSGNLSGIPEALSFDKIVDGGTCPPCTLREFMNYLVYIERSAENLQFYLWFRTYVTRFKLAKTMDISLAMEWTQAMEDEAIARIQKEHAEKARKAPKAGTAAEIFAGSDFVKGSETPSVANTEIANPFGTPPATPSEFNQPFDYSNSSEDDSYRMKANKAFASAGVKAPFTIQPFRKEVDRVVATYIMDGAPRQLNLSDRERKAVLHALAFTTHPSAFSIVIQATELTLRRQAHPNFIRWSICNGNPARVSFARGLGASLILAGFAAAVVLTLSGAARGYRALASVGWVLGISTLIAAWKGMCVVLHGMHHRHVRPWELFIHELEDAESDRIKKHSFDSFGSANSYEEQPWVIRYQRRNIVRKVFDREVHIREPALRQIQDVIFLQSVLCAVVLSAVLTVIFVLVPGADMF